MPEITARHREAELLSGSLRDALRRGRHPPAPPVPASNGTLWTSWPISRQDYGVQVRFLLGPAGSGKTFRCLTEARQALAASPEGAPLLLLAPKQTTYQLERQLLAYPSLSGYARLHILSFERLAHFIFEAPGSLLAQDAR